MFDLGLEVVKVHERTGDLTLACNCEVGADGGVRYALMTCKAKPSHFNQMCDAQKAAKPARRRGRR